MNKKHEDKSVWIPLGMCWGTSLGLILGIFFGNVTIGLGFGPALGMLFGAIVSSFPSGKDNK